jgi:galactokinase/mevalonate kinase-like predicted kinase
MRTDEMARLEQAAAAAGALGGKAAGAGAGGSMFFIMKGEARDAAAALREAGARVLPVSWSAEGMRSW